MAKTDGQGRKQKQEKLLQALRAGNTRTAAAAYAGINHDTFYTWLKEPTFSDAVALAEAHPIITNVATVLAAAKRDWRAAAWWLERRCREHYGRVERQEISGPDGGPVDVRHVAEQLESRLALAAARVEAAGDPQPTDD